MNKGIIFLIGTVVGGGIGAGVTAYFLKDKYEREACDIIDEYHDRCESRILQIMQAYGVEEVDAEDIQNDSDDNDGEDHRDSRDDYANNEGIKKYHHYAAPFNGEKKDKMEDDMTKGQEDVLKYPKYDDCPEWIEEITEDDFMVEEKKTEDIYMVFDFNQDRLLMNPDREDEIDAEEQLHMSRSEIIGNFWKFATDYISDDDGTGAFYVRNNRLMKDIEVIVRYDPNQDVVEVN